jgi:uncharacterized protein YjiS (DUF1127 family)
MATLVHEPLTICQPKVAPAPLRPLAWLHDLVGAWSMRRQDRMTYARMSERDLRDTGINRWEIERELARPFWRD